MRTSRVLLGAVIAIFALTATGAAQPCPALKAIRYVTFSSAIRPCPVEPSMYGPDLLLDCCPSSIQADRGYYLQCGRIEAAPETAGYVGWIPQKRNSHGACVPEYLSSVKRLPQFKRTHPVAVKPAQSIAVMPPAIRVAPVPIAPVALPPISVRPVSLETMTRAETVMHPSAPSMFFSPMHPFSPLRSFSAPGTSQPTVHHTSGGRPGN